MYATGFARKSLPRHSDRDTGGLRAGRGALAIGEGGFDQIRHEDRRTSHGEGCAAIAGPWLRLEFGRAAQKIGRTGVE
jgi:hypothetical protein